MSIVVSVKVYDGVVLGADSQARIHGHGRDGQMGVVQTYSNARKLFQLGNLKIGVATYGIGNIGKRSVESLLLEFNDKKIGNRTELSVKAAADELLDFLKDFHVDTFGAETEGEQPVLGVFIAGYSPEIPTPEEWEFQIPNDVEPRIVRPIDQFGVSWRGIALPFTRLYRGLDSRIPKKLGELGVPQEILSQVEGGMPMRIIFDIMPLQDAVDFAKFILNVTINVARFEVGAASCGGLLDLAVIKSDVGFKWVKRKPLETIMYGR